MVGATESEIKEMLSSLGLSSIEELFSDIPEPARLKRKLCLPPPMSEHELRKHFAGLGGKNIPLSKQTAFLGAGVYRHEIPSVIKALISRGEFATAYTPYQAEASQGTLQAIYEFQTLICNLVGMEVANASHYDGATSLAEAALMALDLAGKKTVLLSRAIHPHYRKVVQTYLKGRNLEALEVGIENGKTSVKGAELLLKSHEIAAMVVQYPNFFGVVEPLGLLSELCKKEGILLIVEVVEPISLGLLKPPGDYGASIVAGEGQSFGIPPSFGGPHVGYLATRKEFIRRIPGRLAGKTLDKNGNPAYTLTLQAREQHIRREKASSNVCTNQSLCAVANAIYLSLLGKNGLKEVSAHCYHKAHYAFREWTKPGFLKPFFQAPFYHEFIVQTPIPALKFAELMEEEGVLAGYPLEKDYPEYPDSILMTVTELNTREEIDSFTQKAAKVYEERIGLLHG